MYVPLQLRIASVERYGKGNGVIDIAHIDLVKEYYSN